MRTTIKNEKRQTTTVSDLESTYLCFPKFRSAIRHGRIDAQVARRLFRHHYARLSDICTREGCSMARARTIHATLESDVNLALVKSGQQGLLKTYKSVEDLIKDLQS